MGYPKGKPRGKQTPEHITKRFTPQACDNHSTGQRKYYQEHPDATKEWHNTPEVFELMQQYGYPLIHRLRRKYGAFDDRCNNPDHPDYKNYGRRGIQNLFTSLEHFLLYVINELHITKLSQIEGLQIDRFPDNDGNYEPGNIRFVTQQENLNNRRNSE